MVGIRTPRADGPRKAVSAVVAGAMALGGAVVIVAAPVAPVPEAAAAPFECPAAGFLVQNAVADAYSVDIATGESELVADNFFPGGVNAIGYNELDDYVYGLSSAGDVLRINDDATTENLGPLDGSVTFNPNPNMGDVTPDGLWYLRNSTVDRTPWAAVDLRPGSSTYLQIVDSGTTDVQQGTAPGSLGGADWAYSPLDGMFYSVGYGAGSGQAILHRFDPATGVSTAVSGLGVLRAPDGSLSQPPGQTGNYRAFGAVYADTDGFLYGSGNGSGHIWRIDLSAPSAATTDFFAYGPSSTANDGARCVSAPLPIDFGDAPASYGTSLADDGARHSLVDYDEAANTAPLMLGDANTVDAEADGVASAAGDSDDSSGVDDEGAVEAPVTVVSGQATAVPVTVTNDTGEPATLAAWLDADRSGTFDDGELVTETVPASSGTSTVDVTLPAAATGETFLRLRLFAGDVADPSPTGAAAGGEVEDHPVTAEVTAEPPTCPVDAFLVQTQPTALRGVDLISGDVSTIETYAGTNVYNALGFNPLDGYLYAIQNPSFQLTRISTDGTIETLGVPPGLNQAAAWQTGDFDPDGHLWIAQGNPDDLRWAELDLAPGSPTYGTVLDTGTTPVASQGLFDISDWAYSLADGGLYSITNLAGTNTFVVARFDTTTHAVSVVATLGQLQAPGEAALGANTPFGAIYADAAGNLYGSHNATGQIWRVNPTSLEATFFAFGPPSAGNDGARCVFAPVAVDLGDAPDTYGTTLSADGARHGLDSTSGTTSLMLGEAVDAEDDGAPGEAADGDDVADLADEDGVADPIELTTGVEATVTVTATNDTEDDATLAGWVDLDGSGTFDGGELVTVPVPAGSGTAAYDLTFPGATAPGDAYARFRLFAGAVDDPSPTGAVSGGEVEDYPVTVQSEPLTCDALYALRGTSAPYDVLEVDTATGALTPVYQFEGTAGTPNALGISADGRYAFSHFATTVYVLDTQTDTTQAFSTGQSVSATHGAIDRATGVYYYGNISGTTAQVYGFDPATGTDLGQVAAISLPGAPGANGDWAFDTAGNLYLSSGAGTNNVYVAAGPLPTTAQPSPVAITGTLLGGVATSTPINGLAVDVQGYMYLSSSTTLYQINPSSGTIVAQPAFSPSGVSVDLASCATPATIEVQKDVVDRRTPDDQFTVSITGGGLVDGLGNTGTTTGTDLGVQDDEGEFGGPVLGLVGETYTVTETAAGTTDLANYTTTWECVNQIDDEEISSGDGTEGQFVMPPASGEGIGAAVLCTFTNDDLPVPGLEITKTADPGGQVLPGGTVAYTVTVENTGETTYTADDPATFTDDLTAVLDDATYNDDAAADVGGTTYAEPELSWEGPLEPGDTATISYSVTVDDPPTGDGELTNTVVGPEESNCVEGAAGEEPEEGCTTDVLVRALAIEKTSDPADEVLPGGTVAYTVTVTNTGGFAYTADDPATFTDDLSEVLDDATYDADADADVGEVTYADPELSWSGALAPGDVATITYSVTVNDPVTGDGDGLLTNAVVGPPESSCDEGTEPGCSSDVPVRSLEIVKTSDPAGEVLPGGTVEYTVTVTNTGQVPYTALDPATFTDDLTEVLDDATWDGDATADVGATSYADPLLVWSGPLAPGDVATITYSVTANDPLTGDGVLTNAIVGPPESGCDDGAEDPGPDCGTVVPVRDLEILKTADPADEVLPGGTITYTVTVTNTGQVAYTDDDPATFDDDLSDVLDDATWDDDAEADVGTPSYTDPELSWSGALEPGAVATITYSVTVNDPLTGNGVLTNAVVGPPESGCVDGGEDPEPGCGTVVPVRALHVVKSSDGSGETVPGEVVTYTITVENTGQVPYTDADPASLTDDLSEILDDATFGEASADVGEVSFEDPTLAWSGALEPGDTAEITYAVTVNDPPTGDGEMFNVVVGPEESNCTDPASADPDCVEPNPVRAMTITKSAAPSGEVLPGDVVAYTITVENVGQVAYTADDPASFTDDLSEVLDDATWNGDATADVGATSYADPELSWSGGLEPGQAATITYSVTVNDPVSGDGVLDNAVVGPPESNCDDGSEDGCHVPVPVRALEITKTADHDEATPGSTVGYTITVTNTGGVDYTEADPASFTDDLTEVLDDATYNDDAAADAGEVTYAEPELSWSGALVSGTTATITYSVTVDDPVSGDGVLDNAVVGPPESGCDDGTEEGCHVPVPVRAVAITKSADPAGQVDAGATVTYTVAVENTGGVDYTADVPASFTDDLSEVLDDATFDDDAEATSGEVSYAEPVLSWSGTLAVGETATVTYSVTVNSPVSGDGTLTNAVVGPEESNCEDGSQDPDCGTDVPVRALHLVKTSDGAEGARPGDTVTYTVTATNTGQVAYTADDPATFDDDLTQVLDDATWNDDASADVGTTSYAEPVLTWTGPLEPGGTATVTYSVTLDDPPTGDEVLFNVVLGPDESNCTDPESDDPDCVEPDPVRDLEILKTADSEGNEGGAVTVGDTVAYTVVVTNTGTADYTADAPASFTDDLTNVLDDATYGGDAAADVGEVSYAEPELSWSGALAAGEAATITYSVTVNDPLTGDGTLANAVLGPQESNCPVVMPGGGGGQAVGVATAIPQMPEGCQVVTPVRAFEVAKTVDVTQAAPGDVVTYTVTVTSVGTAPYTDDVPAGFSDDVSDVLDDATPAGTPSASAGELIYDEPVLSWRGPLEVGGTVTVTYALTVDDPGSGDGTIVNVVTPADGSGGRCTSDDACTTSTDVTPPGAAPGPGPDTPAGPGVLPRTGPEWIGALLAAALFLVVGGGLMLRLRLRRKE